MFLGFMRLSYLAPAALALVLLWAGGLSARQPDKEEDLLARLERERNPVKKAKYEIRLGRLKLHQATDAYDRGSFDQSEQLLSAYLERMKSSWQILRDSGRRAVKQPQGFKELDIELREDWRLLDDLKHRVSYTDRGPIERTAHEVDRIRSEVLHALFPGEHPAQYKSSFLGRGGFDFAILESSL